MLLLAHNIRSLWNVGSLFRTADAFGVEKIYLTGYTATPPRKEISKTALGAEEWVPWEHAVDPLPLILRLKEEGYAMVGLEIHPDAVALETFSPPGKFCLIIGHELLGVPREQLDLCDAIVRISMRGKKESLNVAVAAGIALWALSTRSRDNF